MENNDHTTADPKIEAVQRLYAAYGRGDVDAVLAELAHDIDWAAEAHSTSVPWFGTYRGRSDVPRFFKEITSNVDVTKFAVISCTSNAIDVVATVPRRSIAVGRCRQPSRTALRNPVHDRARPVASAARRRAIPIRDARRRRSVPVSTTVRNHGFRTRVLAAGFGIPAVPGRVSFKVEWTAQGIPEAVNHPDQRCRAVVRSAAAKMEWSARTVDFDFQSAPLATSTTDAAQIGQESNGSYH